MCLIVDTCDLYKVGIPPSQADVSNRVDTFIMASFGSFRLRFGVRVRVIGLG